MTSNTTRTAPFHASVVTVSNKAQLCAALLGLSGSAATPALPFVVRVEGTKFKLRFPEGLTLLRAREIIRNVKRTPASAFRPLETYNADLS